MKTKGIFVYLVFTFVVGYVAQFGLLYAGLIVYKSPTIFSTLILLAVMWIPAGGALAASLLCPEPDRRMPRVWPWPSGAALWLIVAIPVLFALSYVPSWLLGITGPQWGLSTLMGQFSPESLAQIPKDLLPMMAPLIGVFALAFSVLIGATLMAAAALGSELGWRGYLLPRMVAGNKLLTHLVIGLLWGAWFLPLVLGWFRVIGDYSGIVETILCVMGLAVALSFALNRIVLRTGHVGLAALALGLFASQSQSGLSFWDYLFPGAELPWAGPLGVFAIALWFVAAMFPVVLIGKAASTGCETPLGETKQEQ